MVSPNPLWSGRKANSFLFGYEQFHSRRKAAEAKQVDQQDEKELRQLESNVKNRNKKNKQGEE